MGIINKVLDGVSQSSNNAYSTIQNIPGATVVYGERIADNAGTQIVGKVNDLATSTIDKGLNYLPSTARRAISSILGIASTSGIEDFNKLKNISHTLVHKDYVKSFQFKVSISGEPSEFEFYVKDITYGGFELQTDEEQAGALTMAFPSTEGTQRLSLTARDTQDMRVWKFLHDWMRKVTPGDGTVGLPYGENGYVKTAHIYNLTDDGSENLWKSLEVYPTQCGEISRSVDQGEFMEMPVVFTAFHTADIPTASVTTIGNQLIGMSSKS